MELIAIIKSVVTIFSAAFLLIIASSYLLFKIKDKSRKKPAEKGNLTDPSTLYQRNEAVITDAKKLQNKSSRQTLFEKTKGKFKVLNESEIRIQNSSLIPI